MFILYRKRTSSQVSDILALILAGILAFVLVMLSPRVWAADSTIGTETEKPGKLEIIAGKSIILKTTKRVKRISEPDPKVVTAIVLSSHEIYIAGKGAGTTNLILWEDKKYFTSYDIEVSYDITRLKEKLSVVLPEEKEIRVIAIHDSVTLAGRVSNAANMDRALAVARAYAPEGKLSNLMEVGGVQQVMLEVRVAEMSRSTTKKLGINFGYSRGGDFGISTLGGLSQATSPTNADLTVGPVGLILSPVLNAFFRFHSGDATWTGLVDALKEDGLVKVLAEPTLIAISGHSASFLAGGEFPIPVPQGDGDITIEFKQFGVGLSFTPTVLAANKIGIDVTPEVSELDFATAFRFGGYVVPGITSRRASTRIELADGQSFAIAGLLNEKVRESVSKFPFLGDIPIIGVLFRSTSFVKNETELVIIVTPHLVKPLDAKKQTLPTDYFIEPNDAEFYLEGLLEGREKTPGATPKGAFQGNFGHSLS
jgi:pilus assembly protein CpaC